jgi:ankyrin repeat protein
MSDRIEDALIEAAARGHLSVVRRLLDESVPIDAVNEVGYTPLMAAARTYRVDVVALLLRSGADVHRRSQDGHTPLHWSVGSPAAETPEAPHIQAQCVHMLLEHGAIVNAITHSEITPLMSAAWFGCAPSVACLLRAGANHTLRDKSGRTAEDLARLRKHNEIATLLARYTDAAQGGNA